MDQENFSTPGVYINEVNGFPNSVVPVATAVPAFVGYTPQASFEGKSYLNEPVKITSFADFQAFFCFPNPPAPADPAKQYDPHYYLVQEAVEPTTGDSINLNGAFYSIVPDPNTIYYLYNSIQLFYQNGGGDAYIVSVGTYGAPSNNPMTPGTQIINPNVKLNELTNGISLLQNEQEPTMYICPEATLLSVADNGTLMQRMLQQCTEMQTAISIFDVIGGRNPDPVSYSDDIQKFRENTGTNGLDYGAVYYPFIGTTIVQNSDIDYTNLFGGNLTQLESVLSPSAYPNPTVEQIFADMQSPTGNQLTVAQNNAALLNASPSYTLIMQHVLADVNMLPPSGGMAGVMTTIDNQSGVWEAPANTSIIGAATLPIHLTDSQQENLNVDPVSGKSVNAIRFFNGMGILVWGARTLDGNSDDWRYINVRRTLIYLEQSCKLAAKAYVFAPNDKNTWEAVKAMISSFLTNVWKEGGLQGASPADAFSVSCGLGTTMTADDILNGFMNVTVQVAVVHPAEFIVISFQQQMATAD